MFLGSFDVCRTRRHGRPDLAVLLIRLPTITRPVRPARCRNRSGEFLLVSAHAVGPGALASNNDPRPC